MALPGPSSTSTGTSTSTSRCRRPDPGGESWPPNATNPHHRVDFRRRWMPSPEMRPAPLPDAAALPGIEEDELEHEHENAHGQRLGVRRAPRTRSSRAYVCGREENQNRYPNVTMSLSPSPSPNPSRNPNPAPKRSASGSTGTGSSSSRTASVHTPMHMNTPTPAGGQCKRPLRSMGTMGTLSGNGAAAGAYAYSDDAQQAHAHAADGGDLPVHVPRTQTRQGAPAPARASPSANGNACACACARPRPPLREQDRDQGDAASLTVRRKSWLSALSPKKLFFSSSPHPRKRRSVAAAEPEADTSPGRSYRLQVTSPTAAFETEDENENENEYASTSTRTSPSPNAEVLGRTHAAHVQTQVQVQTRKVHAAEWRAYGMWARPWLGQEWGDMVVHNATPPGRTRELSQPEVEAMFATLWEDDRPHPDRWIPRVQHASLPPRPTLWPTPRQTYNPLPEELQLNPFLAHSLHGRPPLHFDLRLRVEDITLGEQPPAVSPYTFPPPANTPWWETSRNTNTNANAGNANTNAGDANANAGDANANANADSTSTSTERPANAFWCDGPNGAQPATYPGVPRLRIAALAGDAEHAFAWPVTVLPHDAGLPVLVADVLHALVANFEERLARAEVDALSDGRRAMCYQAYWRRMRLPVGGRVPDEFGGVRRVDYLGDATFFRGLVPDPGGDGFVLCLGPPP